MEEFKYLLEFPELCTAYFHLCILPHLDMQRQNNKLKHAKKKIKIDGRDAEYEGEVDENGACAGIGTATNEKGTKHYGTWLNDELHGICKFSAQHTKHILTSSL